MPDLVTMGFALALLSFALLALPERLGEGAVLGARYRVVSLLAVAAFSCVLHGLYPEPASRDGASYLLVLTVGYGHLGGAAWFSLGKLRTPAGVAPSLLVLFALTSLATLFAAWSWLANEGMAYLSSYFLSSYSLSSYYLSPYSLSSYYLSPYYLSRYFLWIFFALFAVSTWHVIENDLALASAYGRGLRLAGPSRGPGDQLVALVGTAALTGLGVHLVHAPLRWLSFGDFFSMVVLYHLVGWLVFFADRARRLAGRERHSLLVRLALVHLPPASLALLLMAWTPPALEGMRELVFGPGVYSFFALLHVVQTAWMRGREGPHVG